MIYDITMSKTQFSQLDTLNRITNHLIMSSNSIQDIGLYYGNLVLSLSFIITHGLYRRLFMKNLLMNYWMKSVKQFMNNYPVTLPMVIVA